MVKALQMPRNESRKLNLLCAMLVVAVFACFGRLCTAEFVTHYDDALTVQLNPRFNPPTCTNLAKFWPPFLGPKDDNNLTGRPASPNARVRINHAYGLYIPLTYTLWGLLASIAQARNAISNAPELNPWVFHGANVALHACSTLIVFAIVRRLVRSGIASFCGALLFAIHPIQVEAVGWVSGMKDVLCGLLGLATIRLYIAAVDASADAAFWKNRHAWLALLTFFAALLSKPAAIIVPWIILTIDVLALRRALRNSLIQLWPFLAFSIPFAIIGALAQPAIGVPAAALWARPFIVGDSISFYLWKLIFPLRLGLDYGRTPVIVARGTWLFFAWIIPLTLLIAAWLARRRAPLLLTALLIFLIAPAATLGLLTFLFQYYSTVADHYLYMAMLGPALALAWIISRHPSRATYAAVALVLVGFGIRTFVQCGFWRDDMKLFSNAERVNPRSLLAHTNLGDIDLQRGEFDPAEQHLLAAYAVAPDHVKTILSLAQLAQARNRKDEAIHWLCVAVDVQSRQPPELRGGLDQTKRRLSELENP